VQRVDRWVGLALALLGAAVFVSSRSFPAVPGQKLGAGFLPALVGASLVLAGLALAWRSRRSAVPPDSASAPRAPEQVGSAVVIMAVIGFYIAVADKLGFLIVAPLGLLAVFRALRVGWGPSLAWAVGGTIVVHVAFYKLLRVPLPWGVFRPFY
jgi:putative tricarboxylic transport membrane protein